MSRERLPGCRHRACGRDVTGQVLLESYTAETWSAVLCSGMGISLNDVMAHFGTRLLLAVGGDDDEWRLALSRPISWPSYTNLLDPSPYLRGGELVLTTGPIVTTGSTATGPAYLDGDSALRYVRRLRAVGATGIVIGPLRPTPLPAGSSPAQSGAPARDDDSAAFGDPARGSALGPAWSCLVEACEREHMPLIWSGTIVFIEFVRELGDVIRRAQEEAASWLAAAQQRITDAALTDGGPAAVVEQLAEELDSWVVCFDDLARPMHRSAQAQTMSVSQLETLRSSAARVLETGLRGAMRLDLEGVSGQLQTLGPSHDLLGVVAIGGSPTSHDRSDAERQLLTGAMALLSVSLVRTQEVRRAESGLSTAVLRLLLNGAVGAAHRTAMPFAPLPDSPVVIAAACGEDLTGEQVVSALGRGHRGVRSLIALNEGTAIMVITHRDFDEAVADRPGLHVGVSQPMLYDSVQQGLDQALAALRRALSNDQALLRYRPATADGMLAAVQRVPGLDSLARGVLGSLIEVDRGRSDALIATLRAWLDAGGQWEAAANRLQVHRHTLRARIEKCARVLDVDLRDPTVRHELWLALQALPDAQGAAEV